MKKHDCKCHENDAPGHEEPCGCEHEPSEGCCKGQSAQDDAAALKEQVAAANDKYLRAVADLENYRRRVNREKEELRKYATDALLEEFLPTLDNLRLGLQAAEASPEGKNLLAGFKMVADQIQKVLAEHGLKEVNPLGQAFDPNLAEAAAYEPSVEVAQNHVSQVQRVGYLLHDRLLRPAVVVVSSGAEQ